MVCFGTKENLGLSVQNPKSRSPKNHTRTWPKPRVTIPDTESKTKNFVPTAYKNSAVSPLNTKQSKTNTQKPKTLKRKTTASIINSKAELNSPITKRHHPRERERERAKRHVAVAGAFADTVLDAGQRRSPAGGGADKATGEGPAGSSGSCSASSYG